MQRLLLQSSVMRYHVPKSSRLFPVIVTFLVILLLLFFRASRRVASGSRNKIVARFRISHRLVAIFASSRICWTKQTIVFGICCCVQGCGRCTSQFVGSGIGVGSTGFVGFFFIVVVPLYFFFSICSSAYTRVLVSMNPSVVHNLLSRLTLQDLFPSSLLSFNSFPKVIVSHPEVSIAHLLWHEFLHGSP